MAQTHSRMLTTRRRKKKADKAVARIEKQQKKLRNQKTGTAQSGSQGSRD